jgi:hypothetical protein
MYKNLFEILLNKADRQLLFKNTIQLTYDCIAEQVKNF